MEDKQTWLFNSAGFHGNPKWLFLHVLHNRPEIEAIWLADNAAQAEVLKANELPVVVRGTKRARAVMRQTSVWVVNQVKEVIPKQLRNAVMLNLWHGVGVKSIERGMNEGYLRERIAKKYIQNNQYYHDRQLFLVTSEAMEEHFTRYIGLAERNKVRAGYPQNVARSQQSFASYDHDLLGRRGLPPGTRIAVHAPTPRRESTTAFLDQMLPDVPALLARLEEVDMLLVLKMHPHMTADPSFQRFAARFADEPRLMFWDNREDLYEVMDQVDTAVVDYSSILYDFLAHGVPEVIRYVPDYADGANPVLQEGTSYPDLSCGAWAESFEAFLDALGQRGTVNDDDRTRLTKHFWSYAASGRGAEDLDKIVDAALAFRPVETPLKRLYTYDVFDTLISRRGVLPRSVHRYVRERLEESDAGFPTHLVRRYEALRDSAEKALKQYYRRDPQRASSQRFEVQLHEIMAWLGNHFDLTPEQQQMLVDWEVEAELRGVLPRPAEVEELLAHRAEGNDVVMVSDMYLAHDVVRAMVDAADSRLADVPLFVSSTYEMQKSTKLLYLQIYDELGYDHAEWIHTGDNPHADVRQAQELGITTRQVDLTTHDGLGKRLANQIPGYDGDLAAGLITRKRMASDAATDADYFAYSYIASCLVPYVDWALEDAVRRGYRTLYFITRDGDHLKRAADALIELRGLDLSTKLIHGSRRAWRLASQAGGLDEANFTVWGLFGATEPAGILDALELDLEEFNRLLPGWQSMMEQPTLSADDQVHLAEACAESSAIRAHLLERAREDEVLAVEYLRQEIDPDESFAFVEFWGRGHTQDCLAKLLATAFTEDIDCPMYYARSVYPSIGRSIRHNFTMSDHNLIAIESVFSNLPYGTTTGYRRDDSGRVVPIAEPREPSAALYEATVRQLPVFAADYCATVFGDPVGTRLALFDAVLGDFKRNPQDPYYPRYMASLQDAVAIGAAEQELAPPLTLEAVYDLTLGAPVQKYTRSTKLSVTRSTPEVRRTWRELREHLRNGKSPEDAVAIVQRERRVREEQRAAKARATAAATTTAPRRTWRSAVKRRMLAVPGVRRTARLLRRR